MLTLTFVPPLTALKVENSALPFVVSTRSRTIEAPAGTATVTGTPDEASAAAATVAGAATRAAANVAPANGTAAASVVGAEAASAWAGGTPGSTVGVGSRFGFSSWSTRMPPRSETIVTHVQVVTGTTESRAS